MKQIITGVCKSWYTEESIREVLKAQIDHSFNFSWAPNDILVFTDFDFEYKDVQVIKDIFPRTVGSNTKTYAASYCYNELEMEEVLWCHDLDAWQFKDLQHLEETIQQCYFAARMLPTRHRVQGASVFYSKKAKVLLKEIVERMTRRKTGFEEPTLTSFFVNENLEDFLLIPMDYNVNSFDFIKKRHCEIDKMYIIHQVYDCIRMAKQRGCFDEFNNSDGFAFSILEALEKLSEKYLIDSFLNRELTRDYLKEDRKRKRAKKKERFRKK